ncbi:MAG: LysM peptidoglycan-binding domain-containing protein [Prevotellaceae bacterium]|jgi:murein DD-endopeptidase MepM/ murein hydrolase activator NlpD|nr:LysM peptidoglycan-binding domain-containing protein [Prevotellaceae bacterium]
MKFNVKIFIALVFAMFLCKNILSQQPEKYRIGHLSYILHNVERGETLSKIAAKYHATVREIMDVNEIPDSGKIIEGQKINIPDYSDFIDQYPRNSWVYEYYVVKKGDKIKNIAKRYGIKPDDIKNVNWRLDKLREGATVRIPVRSEQKILLADNKAYSPENAVEKDKNGKNREKDKNYETNPALNYWATAKNDSNSNNTDKNKDKNKNGNNGNVGGNTAVEYGVNDCNSFVFSEGVKFTVSLVVPLTRNEGTVDPLGTAFLRGALIAVNDMKNKGCTVNLNIFDAGRKNRIAGLIQSGELKSSNIIIAPTELAELGKLAAFAKENRTALVIQGEGAGSSNLFEANPYVIRLHTSDNAIYQKLAGEKHDAADVYPVLVKPEKVDTLMLENYRAALRKQFGKFVEYTHSMGLSLNNLGTFKNTFNADKRNLVFVCSNTQSFVSDLIIRLNTLRDYSISVYGKDRWSDFNLINRSYFFDVNLHLAMPACVDYKNNEVKHFVRLFRGAYNDEPDKYAFLGYDVSYYFLTVMQKYGHSFQDCFTEFSSTMLQSQFKFRQNRAGDGYVNDGCFILEYLRKDIETRRE